jgi:hypothetical protein
MGMGQLFQDNELDIHTKSADMVQLVEELEFMPLAIVQAASYINHYSSRCSICRTWKSFGSVIFKPLSFLSGGCQYETAAGVSEGATIWERAL